MCALPTSRNSLTTVRRSVTLDLARLYLSGAVEGMSWSLARSSESSRSSISILRVSAPIKQGKGEEGVSDTMHTASPQRPLCHSSPRSTQRFVKQVATEAERCVPVSITTWWVVAECRR